jgi:hypothetical protein
LDDAPRVERGGAPRRTGKGVANEDDAAADADDAAADADDAAADAAAAAADAAVVVDLTPRTSSSSSSFSSAPSSSSHSSPKARGAAPTISDSGGALGRSTVAVLTLAAFVFGMCAARTCPPIATPSNPSRLCSPGNTRRRAAAP